MWITLNNNSHLGGYLTSKKMLPEYNKARQGVGGAFPFSWDAKWHSERKVPFSFFLKADFVNFTGSLVMF